MITISDFYSVVTALVPLYVAMFLAYASVKWWKIFSPEQCSGINRFVALFAVPFLSFKFISMNNPYTMNAKFILADTLQKLIVLLSLTTWANITRHGSIEWVITLFSITTLPNTLVIGVPLLNGMYGDFYGSLMIQVVVLQSIVWYTLLQFLFEFRAAKLLISNQFPDTAASIASIEVDADVVSLDGGTDVVETEAEVVDGDKLHVTVRRSNASRLDEVHEGGFGKMKENVKPPASVMTKLILTMVWRKLCRNPNTYASLLGLIWSLISYRYHVKMPIIISKSISILSDTGLGMAMFSLGLFMAMQPRLIACGKRIAAYTMALKFLVGPAIMAAASLAVGVRGTLLRVAIVQAALPLGIVTFVFAKEHGVYPDILSTGVIFGMLVALPVTLFYYIALGN